MITFVTHLRYDSDDRLKNLQTIMDYYYNNIPDVKFIFIEDDSEHNKAFDKLKYPKGTSFNFMKNDSVYYRTRALNHGFKMSNNPIVVSLDTDCIVPISSILMCRDALLNGATAAWPYNGYFIDTDFNLHDEFLKNNLDYDVLLNRLDGNYNLPLSSSYRNFHVRCTSSDHLGTGGIVMFNKELFLKAGGYNEKFIGWGCEDNEIVSRLKILNYSTFRDTRNTSVCFHLFHRYAQRAENPFFDLNSKEWSKISKMNKEQLESYIETWK